MVGFGGGSGNPTATEGTGYGEKSFDGSSDAEVVLPLDTESSSWVVKAPTSNTDPIYVGWDDDVTNTDGFPLDPGSAVSIDIDNTQQELWGVSDTSGDVVRFLAVE